MNDQNQETKKHNSNVSFSFLFFFFFGDKSNALKILNWPNGSLLLLTEEPGDIGTVAIKNSIDR